MFGLCWLLRMPSAPGALLGILTALTFYKVGHRQFLASVLVLLAYWLAREGRKIAHERGIRAAALGYTLWVNLHSLVYVFSGGLAEPYWGFRKYPWNHWGAVAGVLNFGVSCWLLLAILRWRWRQVKAAKEAQSSPRVSVVCGPGVGRKTP